MNLPNRIVDLPDYSIVQRKLQQDDSKHVSLMRDMEKIVREGYKDRWQLNGQEPPIYAVNSRIKSSDSLYLKTKRKVRPAFMDTADIVGMRVLVLFEKHLADGFFYILRLLNKFKTDKGLTLYEVKFYGMSNDFMGHVRYNELWACCLNDVIIEEERKISGYQSIHFLLKSLSDPEIKVEIQLRTLLQNVWSEMEHKLAYKQGKSDPTIKAGFDLLKEELDTMGKRLSHLMDVKRRHDNIYEMSLRKSQPLRPFWYEDGLIPVCFSSPHLAEKLELYQQYVEAVSSKNSTASEEEISNILSQIRGIARDARRTDCSDEDIKRIQYWVDMEEGYWFLYQRKFSKARKLYEQVRLRDEFSNNPAPYFRYGESLFIEKNEVKALQEFDLAVQKIVEKFNAGERSESFIVMAIRMLLKIDTVYDLYGLGEYSDYCIELSEMQLAMIDFLPGGDKNDFDGSLLKRVENNLCWSLLGKFVNVSGSDPDAPYQEKNIKYARELHARAYQLFLKIEEYIERNPEYKRSNILDTIAQFALQTYRCFVERNADKYISEQCMADYREMPGRLLTKADVWSKDMMTHKNISAFEPVSFQRQMYTMQEIMAYILHGESSVEENP